MTTKTYANMLKEKPAKSKVLKESQPVSIWDRMIKKGSKK